MEPNITMMEVGERAPHIGEVLLGAPLRLRTGNDASVWDCPIPYVIDGGLSSEARGHVRFLRFGEPLLIFVTLISPHALIFFS